MFSGIFRIFLGCSVEDKVKIEICCSNYGHELINRNNEKSTDSTTKPLQAMITTNVNQLEEKLGVGIDAGFCSSNPSLLLLQHHNAISQPTLISASLAFSFLNSSLYK